MYDFAIADIAIAIVIVLLVAVSVPLWKLFREYAKSLEYGRFVEVVEAAVAYAEQTMKTEAGQEKLNQVMTQLQAAFPNFDVSFIRIFVEQCVRNMNEREKGK